MKTTLGEISIWAKFQVKIQNQAFSMPEVPHRLLENVYIKKI
jgi:hypothetical protein